MVSVCPVLITCPLYGTQRYPVHAQGTGTTDTKETQKDRISRQAQLINCWLVSREVDRGSTRSLDRRTDSLCSPKISSPLPDNIILSKYLISIFYPIIIGLNQKTSFGSFGRIQRVTNTSSRYVHHGQGYSPFNSLHQSHLITIKNCGNQLAQVSNLKLLSFSINSCWRYSIQYPYTITQTILHRQLRCRFPSEGYGKDLASLPYTIHSVGSDPAPRILL